MTNTNSYMENMAQLTGAANEILEYANAMNETIAGNNAEVVMGDDIVLPSYQNIIDRVDRVEKTMSKFTSGKGVIETDDGTHRKIKVEAISKPAPNILNLGAIDKFNINPNWFFELLQYPRCVVKIDLAGKIEDDSDRVYVSRIIVPMNQERLTATAQDDILTGNMDYGTMINYLENNYIEYKEDKDDVDLPLTYEKFNGNFQVTGINLLKNPDNGLNYTWYYLSTINYAKVNIDDVTEDDGYVLKIGDYLRFNNSLFKIIEINQSENRVRLEYNVGYDTVGVGDTFELYNDPFREKIIDVGIGVDEIDIIYIKGVNEKFNILSRAWSNPIAFITNELTFSDDNSLTFKEYYTKNVSDFGNMLISMIKEGRLPAYGNKTPIAPVLNENDLKVVQINTQLNATLDEKRYKAITSEIASVKSDITATRNSIASNKNILINKHNTDERKVIQNYINRDTDKLNTLTAQFSSLVDDLNTMLNEAGAINYTPKYHVRGFFTIPGPQYTIDNGDVKIGKQSVIGFETMYRYLRTNNTGAALNTFHYYDNSKGTSENGVFSDWCIVSSPILEKIYNPETDTFEWKSETVDGTHVTINQIDIPIRSGEKVEIKVRSVSEAGYPYAPLKSEWSNSVIIGFPSNLTTDNSVTTILNNVKTDMISVMLQETLTSAGLYNHISDSNAKYKHNAEDIEFTETVTDASGNTSTNTMSLADKIRSLTQTTNTIKTSIEKEESTASSNINVSD